MTLRRRDVMVGARQERRKRACPGHHRRPTLAAMVRVRFAPSPTGSLHLGGALVAVANRRFADEQGGTLLLRIDDTDPARDVPRGENAIVADLEWLGVRWEEGPVRQSERQERYREAASRV